MRDVSGSASFLEYAIILPVCLLSVMILFFAGYYLCHYAVLDAAADRAVLTVQGIYEETGGFGGGSAEYLAVQEIAVQETREIIDEISFLGEEFLFDSPEIDIHVDRMMIGHGINVEISRAVRVPEVLRQSFMESAFILRANSYGTLLCPAKMLSTTDFIIEVIEKFSGADIDISSALGKVAAKVRRPLSEVH
jgi:hypothetical protein